MARKNKNKHHEINDIPGQVNPSLVVDPGLMGAPVGMTPILPIPTLVPDDYSENPDKNNNIDRFS